ncbi:CdaR family transcriptional regulator [Anaerospora hongkongensis]|uniref:CdaR family transcriptional regulator n=1 Tax=Anaerospora hongkongensis TaxID=244830 RepID=UPI002FDA8D80
MLITYELAQQIVDHILPIVQQNVNIMNSSGLIMGSGQKNRINTYHQGAKEVIARGEVVEIHPDELALFPGALPGLNWPIILDKQIVGVVGVSGDPAAVRSTAKLVKMVTELILERESLLEGFRSNLQLKEHFVQLLLSGKWEECCAQIKSTAQLLRFTLELPRAAAVANIRPLLDTACSQYGTHELVMARTRDVLTQNIERSELIDERDLVVVTEDKCIIFKHFSQAAEPAVIQNWGQQFQALLNREYSNTGFSLGLGSLTNSPEQLYTSYTEALFACRQTDVHAVPGTIYHFDVLTAYLLAPGSRTSACLAFQNLRTKITTRLGKKYDLQNTINTLLEHNLNVSSAAKALFIHRNTLVFRLEKLQELTGLCPAQFLNHAILCKLLFQKPDNCYDRDFFAEENRK